MRPGTHHFFTSSRKTVYRNATAHHYFFSTRDLLFITMNNVIIPLVVVIFSVLVENHVT